MKQMADDLADAVDSLKRGHAEVDKCKGVV